MNHQKKTLVLAIALAYNLPIAMAGQPKLDICHYNKSGFKKLISIPAKAANKHIQKHGDSMPEFRYRDADGDTYGDSETFIETCEEEDGFVENDDDLDDTKSSITNVEPTAAPPQAPPPTPAPTSPPMSPPAPPAGPPGPPPGPTMSPPGPPGPPGPAPTSPPGPPT